MTEPSHHRQPPTLATVAHLAGVSRQTVSNAVNSPELLRPETLARVQRVIAEVGYAPNRAARNLRTRRARLVGLQFDPEAEHTADALLDRFVHTLVDRSAEAGLHVLLFSGRTYPADPADPADPAEQSGGEEAGAGGAVAGHAELWRTGAVDAFVLTDTYRGDSRVSWLQGEGAPVAAFGRPWEDPDPTHPWVDVDGAAGTAAATRHLLEAGHLRIAWLGQEPGSLITADRRSGWAREMTAAGLEREGLELATAPSVAGGREAAHRLLDHPAESRPTAVVAASDTLAFGVLQALHERGLRAGADLAVTGFDDSQSAQLVPGGLTSLRQPLEEVAVALVRALSRMLGVDLPGAAAGGSGSGAPPAGVLLEPRLVIRGSSS